MQKHVNPNAPKWADICHIHLKHRVINQQIGLKLVVQDVPRCLIRNLSYNMIHIRARADSR